MLKEIFLFLACLFVFQAFIFSITTDEFLSNELARQRYTQEGSLKLLSMISNELSENTESAELNWLYAAMLYFYGDYYEEDTAKKKEYFTQTKDFAFKAVLIDPNSADAHYWLGVGYAKWSEANGILDSLFYADDVRDEMTKVITLQTNFFKGIAWAIRAKVYNVAPGWPMSVGDKEESYRNISKALQIGSDFRFIHQLYAEMLLNDGNYREAKKVIEKALALPLDEKYLKEEEKVIGILQRYLIMANKKLNVLPTP